MKTLKQIRHTIQQKIAKRTALQEQLRVLNGEIGNLQCLAMEELGMCAPDISTAPTSAFRKTYISNEMQARVLSTLNGAETPLSEIVRKIGGGYMRTAIVVSEMTRAGKMRRTRRGFYAMLT